MKSSSLKLVGQGISNPSDYRDALIHEWYLRKEYATNLAMYMLKETPIELFQANSKDGELTVQGKKYSITWIHSPSKIKKADTKRLLVSIRYCRDLDRGYVLVKLLETGQFEELEY